MNPEFKKGFLRGILLAYLFAALVWCWILLP